MLCFNAVYLWTDLRKELLREKGYGRPILQIKGDLQNWKPANFPRYTVSDWVLIRAEQFSKVSKKQNQSDHNYQSEKKLTLSSTNENSK